MAKNSVFPWLAVMKPCSLYFYIHILRAVFPIFIINLFIYFKLRRHIYFNVIHALRYYSSGDFSVLETRKSVKILRQMIIKGVLLKVLRQVLYIFFKVKQTHQDKF